MSRKSNAYSKYLPLLPMTMSSFFENSFQQDPRADKSFGNEQGLSKIKAYKNCLDIYDPLSRQYVYLSIKEDNRQYGIKYDIETVKFKIGRQVGRGGGMLK